MKKKLVVLSFVFAVFVTYSQENNEVDEIIDAVILLEGNELIDLINELNTYQVIITSVDFNNKAYFLGRDLGIEQYSLTSQLMYENSNGIFAGITGNYYSKFDPKWDVTVLSAGYGKNFGKRENFRFELGYSRYIFSDSNSNDFENSIDGNFYVSTNKNSFGATVNTSYLFGEKSGFQSNLSIYGSIQLFRINARGTSHLVFGPDLSFLFASENIDTSRFDNLSIDSPYINLIVDSFETFRLRNIQLQLPLIVEFENLSVETGYNINFPQAFKFENSVENTSFFNIRLSYIFPLK